MTLTYKDVAEIIKIIDASNCDEVIIELGDTKIVVRRGSEGAVSAGPGTAPQRRPVQAPPSAVTSAKPEAGAAKIASTLAHEADASSLMRAPMTGTFYRAPSPKDPPFVEEGAAVKKGDTLCMIEVMKLFTSIQAETDGIVTRIYPDDATVVQVDQPLFRIEAA